MNSILSFFSGLSLAQLTLCAAFVILFFVLVVFFWPSKGEDAAADQQSAPASSKKGKNSFVRKEPGWDSNHSNQVSQDSYAAQGEKQGFFSKLFGSKKSQDEDHGNPSMVTTKIGFNHPNVTDHFKELVKPGPASDLKTPDTDELDQIFTTMIKAGAVSSKPHLVTNFEHQYLEKLRIWFSYRCYIYCQVSVGSVVSINADVSDLPMPQRLKFAQKCQNMSFDFLLVEKSTERIVCAIELDDPTHLRPDRISRDRRLDKVCAAANIPIFHITNIYHKPDLRRMIKTSN